MDDFTHTIHVSLIPQQYLISSSLFGTSVVNYRSALSEPCGSNNSDEPLRIKEDMQLERVIFYSPSGRCPSGAFYGGQPEGMTVEMVEMLKAGLSWRKGAPSCKKIEVG